MFFSEIHVNNCKHNSKLFSTLTYTYICVCTYLHVYVYVYVCYLYIRQTFPHIESQSLGAGISKTKSDIGSLNSNCVTVDIHFHGDPIKLHQTVVYINAKTTCRRAGS